MEFIVESIGHHASQLVGHGESERAKVVEHIYSVNYLAFFILLFADLWRVAYLRSHTLYSKKPSVRPVLGRIAKRAPSLMKYVVTFYGVGAFFYIFFARFVQVQFERQTLYSWVVGQSDSLFFIQAMCLEGTYCFLRYAYTFATVGRLSQFSSAHADALEQP
jgi:hypothetical protein